MKKNVFSRPEASESHSRNAFDRSFVTNFNLSAGMLLPSFCKFVFGKSHVRINQSSFFRSADVNTPAFPSMPLYTDYYFVPMHQLVSNWNAFRSQTNDRFSSALGVPAILPSFSVNEIRNAIKDSLTNGLKDGSNRYTWHHGALRLLDLLDYGITADGYDESSTSEQNGLTALGNLSPLAACAYQKIYYDHYRNTAYEANDVAAYNLDSMFTLNGDSASTIPLSKNDVLKYFNLHYVNYRRDFFNTIYPSLNFIASAASGFTATKFKLPSNVLGMGFVSANGNFSPSSSVNTVPVVTDMAIAPSRSNSSGSLYGFTLQNLRAAFAVEKLARISSFAPQHVVDQFQARFGYRPKSDSLNESVRLGSFTNNIIVGEVTQTATTQTTSGSSTVENRLGTVGGKGIGASDRSKPISYDVPEDGFVIGVSYVLPRLTYDSYKVDMIHQQFYPEDWSLPEFENLGLQPILLKNVALAKPLNTISDVTCIGIGNYLLGYQPRDMQYKASISTNHGLFNRKWQLPNTSSPAGVLSAFVFHGKYDYTHDSSGLGGNGVTYAYFKCAPSDLDDIFAQDYDGTQFTDQFFGQMSVDFACIQDKPIFGIPRL